MDKFKIFHRHRFLKIWLIAFSCQFGPLLLPLEAKKPHSSRESKASWFSKFASKKKSKRQKAQQAVQESIAEKDLQDPSQSKTSSEEVSLVDAKEMQRGRNENLTPQPKSIQKEPEASQIKEQPYFQNEDLGRKAPHAVQNNFEYQPHDSPIPQNGQWPSYSRSELQNVDAPHPFEPSFSNYPRTLEELEQAEAEKNLTTEPEESLPNSGTTLNSPFSADEQSHPPVNSPNPIDIPNHDVPQPTAVVPQPQFADQQVPEYMEQNQALPQYDNLEQSTQDEEQASPWPVDQTTPQTEQLELDSVFPVDGTASNWNGSQPTPALEGEIQPQGWVEQPVDSAYFHQLVPSYILPPSPPTCNVHDYPPLAEEEPPLAYPSFDQQQDMPPSDLQSLPIQNQDQMPIEANEPQVEPLPFYPVECDPYAPVFPNESFSEMPPQPEFFDPKSLSDGMTDLDDQNGDEQKQEKQERAENLAEGKGQIKLVKKPQPESNDESPLAEAIIGKQNVVSPIVGANLEDLKKANFIEKETIKKTSPSEAIVQKNTGSNNKSFNTPRASAEIAQQIPPPRAPTTTPAPSQPTAPSPSPLQAPRAPTPLPAPAQQIPAAPPRVPTIITPTSPGFDNVPTPNRSGQLTEISNINFNNVSIVEYIRFISRISNKNFVFDDEELQFNVTIVSEEPTTVENLMAALLQELRIRDLELLEQGNNIIVHRNPRVRAPARIVSNGTEPISSQQSELVTRVFRLNTLDPIKASEIIRPLLSDNALVEVLRDTNNLIITDLVTNVNKIAQLIGTLDAPNSGITIGQYVVRNAFVDSLVDLATKILQPIAQGNPFVLVPHPVSNSIYIVSNAFIVEKGLAILQNLDLNEGRTKILSLEGLQPTYPSPEEERAAAARREQPTPPAPLPLEPRPIEVPPLVRPEGAAESYPLGPEGRVPPPAPFPLEARPSAIFDETRDFLPGGIGAPTRWTRELPVGHIERTMFYIYKLRYRRGDQIELALRKIGASLQLMGTANADLISAINSSQWIESSNALIFTGTAIALDKVRELILEVDVPLRQVFIEMLILDTTVRDSLSYSVDWANRFGGGSTTGEQGFLNPVANPGTAAFINTVEALDVPIPPAEFPIATGFLDSGGFASGVIGTHLSHNGLRFSTMGALVKAIHTDAKANILLNPKIITEDNHTAEIFVGETDRYKTQSITNDLGTLVTNNFQFIDVGTTLRVTPLIGNNGIITLEIIQESTAPAATANLPGSALFQDFNLVTVLTKTRTVTTIHVPNGFFVILSGMIQDNDSRSYSRIPCLGGIPIIGGFGKAQDSNDVKRNLMLFIRPLIVDTDDELEDITRRQQDIYREKSKFRRAWNYEVDEGLNFLNIKPTDPDEIGCNER